MRQGVAWTHRHLHFSAGDVGARRALGVITQQHRDVLVAAGQNLSSHNAPISFVDCGPHFTRCGGCCGFLAFRSELSYVKCIDSVVPLGRNTGVG